MQTESESSLRGRTRRGHSSGMRGGFKPRTGVVPMVLQSFPGTHFGKTLQQGRQKKRNFDFDFYPALGYGFRILDVLRIEQNRQTNAALSLSNNSSR